MRPQAQAGAGGACEMINIALSGHRKTYGAVMMLNAMKADYIFSLCQAAAARQQELI